MCGPSACYATADLTAKTLEALKKAQTMTVMARFPAPGEPSGHELSFNIPVKDFASAFDGKPTDPKVLEQQHEALQQQLQKKAEEQRKMLEKQQSAAPAAPAPAAPAAPALPPLRQSSPAVQASRDGGRPGAEDR